jgi:hypothetical protein
MAVLKFQMCLSEHKAYEDVIICLIGEKREYKPVITERKNFSFASTVLTEQALSSNLQYLRYQYRAFSSLLKKVPNTICNTVIIQIKHKSASFQLVINF